MSMREAAAMESFLQGATKTTKRGGRRTNIAWMTLDGTEGGRNGSDLCWTMADHCRQLGKSTAKLEDRY